MHKPVSEIVADLRQTIERSGVSQTEIAAKTGVNQSTISRLLLGRGSRTRLTKSLLALCSYAGVGVEKRDKINVARNRVLVSALAEVWDGSEEDARRLARIIRAVGEALSSRLKR